MEPNARLKPIKEFRIYKRDLPHWELPGSVYFITFSTTDGYQLSDAAKDIVFSSIKFHAGKKYTLHACVIMDTHVHCILQPLEIVQTGTSVQPEMFYSLSQIMHSIKSYSANRIQRLLGKKGSVWQDENYDRIVRDETAYETEMNYVVGNPLKAGLVDKPKNYRWLFWEGQE